MNNKLVIIVSIVVLLNACSTQGTKDSSEASQQFAARTALLAETKLIKSSVSPFPVGNKRLSEPAVKDISGRRCDEGSFALNELVVKNISLSNRDVASAANLLGIFGYSTMSEDDAASLGTSIKVPCSELPIILIPHQDDEINLTIGTNDSTNTERTGTGNISISPLRKVKANDLDQLIIFYHEEQHNNITRLEDIITSVVDTAAPQVYIETMVLEVSEEDSKELGIAYQTANIDGLSGNSLLNLGALEVGNGATFDFTRNSRADADGNLEFIPGSGIEAKVKALVDNGKAEVLARPSILTLSNRQAVIQIVDVVQSPIVESSIGGSGELVISSYQFEPLLLGITLNLRPRVSGDRNWVSMEIDANVESEVDENSGTVFSPDGEGGRIALAEKKGSASRKVKSTVRIPDRTPIIIGGLVAGKDEKQKSRVPLLGDLPLIGGLFGATDNETQKREIVIVITPHILAEDAIGIKANMASDSVMQRQSDLKLFNNHHKIAASEVYDMNFLLSDPQFAMYRKRAEAILNSHPEYGSDKTLSAFVEDRFPGDDVLVTKMLFDIVTSNLNRRNFDSSLVYVPSETNSGETELLTLADMLDGVDFGNREEAIQISIAKDDNGRTNFIRKVIHPSVRDDILDPSTIVLRTENDKQRLLAAIATDIILRKNGGLSTLNLQTFIPGSTITLDDDSDYHGYKLSGQVLKNYNTSMNFNRIFKQELNSAYKYIDTKYETLY